MVNMASWWNFWKNSLFGVMGWVLSFYELKLWYYVEYYRSVTKLYHFSPRISETCIVATGDNGDITRMCGRKDEYVPKCVNDDTFCFCTVGIDSSLSSLSLTVFTTARATSVTRPLAGAASALRPLLCSLCLLCSTFNGNKMTINPVLPPSLPHYTEK